MASRPSDTSEWEDDVGDSGTTGNEVPPGALGNALGTAGNFIPAVHSPAPAS